MALQERVEESFDSELIDITADLKKIASTMGTGEMVMAPDYTLQASMSALELMSPKMDPGMQFQGYVTIQERHSDGSLSIPPKSEAEVVSMMDHLMKLEMSWYSGHPLTNTVYSCIFTSSYGVGELAKLARPYLGDEVVGQRDETAFLAYVVLTLSAVSCKLCELTQELVRMADVYEEEDYSLYIGSLQLDPFGALSVEKIKSMLLDLESNLERRGEASASLLAIVKMRRLHLEIFVLFDKPDLSGIPTALKLLEQLKTIFENAAGPKNRKNDCDVNPYFDPLLCQKLLGPLPPRSLDPMSAEDAHIMFSKVIDDLITVCKFMECENLSEVYQYLSMFSERKPNIIPRSRLVALLYTADSHRLLGKYSYQNLIVQDMEEAGVPEAIIKDEICQDFIDSVLVRAVYDVLRLATANRARKRRKIVHLLKHWREIQPSADYHDHQIYLKGNFKDESFLFNSIGSWSELWVSRLMLEFLCLGFELDLYALHEVDMMLWSVDFLLQSLSETRQRMKKYKTKLVEHEIVELMAQLQTDSQKKTVKKKSKSAKELKEKKKRLNRLKNEGHKVPVNKFRDDERYLQEMLRNLSSGTLCTILGLRCKGVYKDPDLSFGNRETRYAQRLKCLSGLRPDVYDFQVFQNVSDTSKYKEQSIFSTSNAKLTQVKRIATQLMKRDVAPWFDAYRKKKLMSLVRVSVSNNLLSQTIPSGSGTRKFQHSVQNSFGYLPMIKLA
mmetsp:Transcript_8173/g.10635  ORF Transcript_8173/g.10635 Transcript_8173/m.10635 type:complete len:727 (-) Transcript_8173:86-2266(-)